jgi:hypothetical protein
MPYGSPNRQQMDLAHKHGLKVIYSIKDWYAGSEGCPPSIRTVADEEPQVRSRVREFCNHPALLAWYLNDELSQEFLAQLEAHQPHRLARVHAGKLYLAAVNDGDGEGAVLFRLPSLPASIRLLGDNRPVPLAGTKLQVQLPRLAVQWFEIKLAGPVSPATIGE